MKKSRVSITKKIQHRFSGKPQSFERARLVPGGDKGFTVKELIMAIVVIGVLFGLAIPQYYTLRNARENVQTLQKSEPQTNKPQKKNLKNFFRRVFKK